ncbi:MAG TPA: hypothetical protein VHR84_19050 [Terriglobales bacterium]|jgi:polyhydroxyalkanoate synthesis regulator phasin|nr:hypothetical protein [Terriglobales bacterium]
MKQAIAVLTILMGLSVLPALAQSEYPTPADQNRAAAGDWHGRLSAEDQKEFDEHYGKWQKANAKNDRDEVDKQARKMEEIMGRYQIPVDTPFDAIVSSGFGAHQVDVRQYQGRLNHDDQKKFDKAYEDWVEHRRKNDHDDVAKDEGKMLEIMSRYNIPRDVPYEALASGSRGY